MGGTKVMSGLLARWEKWEWTGSIFQNYLAPHWQRSRESDPVVRLLRGSRFRPDNAVLSFGLVCLHLWCLLFAISTFLSPCQEISLQFWKRSCVLNNRFVHGQWIALKCPHTIGMTIQQSCTHNYLSFYILCIVIIFLICVLLLQFYQICFH